MLGIEGSTLTWLLLAIIAAIVEVSIPQFGVIFVSLAAVVAALAALAGAGGLLQSVVFVVVLAASLVLLRPRFMARFSQAPGVPSRTEALIGRLGIVTIEINPTTGTGRVNVEGQDWAARSRSPLSVDTQVRVVGANGIVLEVTPA
jgi:membrane protein implicated in regulation of membrane protease activity